MGSIVTFGLATNSSSADDIGMAYIIERNDRYYVVAYDGNDPRTGKDGDVGIPQGDAVRTPKRSRRD